MKIVAIGDTHGREVWKDIVSQNPDADKIVFIGDYFDTHEKITPIKQLEVFLDILQYKTDNFDKVEMLWGNHDEHYRKGVTQTYSGYQYTMQYTFRDALEKTIALNALSTHYVWDNFLFVHAGVTKTWMEKWEALSLSDLPDIFREHLDAFGFQHGAGRFASPYGDNIWQSPLWVRPDSLIKDGIEGYNQVVGHTTQDKLTVKKRKNGDKFYFIDTLGTSKEYLIIEDGVVAIGKLD